METLPLESQRKYTKRVEDYQKYHAAYMLLKPTGEVEETFLMYFKQMHNPKLLDAVVPNWFPLVPTTARHNAFHTGGSMVSTIRTNVSIVEKFLSYSGHAEAAKCPVLKDSMDQWAKSEKQTKANVFTNEQQVEWYTYAASSVDVHVKQIAAYTAIATDTLARSCEVTDLKCGDVTIMQHRSDPSRRMVQVVMRRRKGE